jgi:hemerythrin-like domain-containing protein
MVQATEILKAEHRVIEQVLDCLERIVAFAIADGRIDRSAAEQAIDFFRAFADGCHYKKEEAHLFPAMESRGFSRQNGPTGVMLSEHEEGRQLIGRMKESLEGAARGQSEALRQFVDCASAYNQLLRSHIYKQDHCLFPMADSVLGEQDQASLIESFESVEHEAADAALHEKCLPVADSLAQRFGVPCVRRDEPHAVSHCGHA